RVQTCRDACLPAPRATNVPGARGARVRLSPPYMSLQWRPGRVRLTCRRAGRQEMIQARRAVVTLPIGVLQAGRPIFDPPLPAWKRRAIDALHMGRVVVIHLLFDDWFWRSGGINGWGAHQGRISFWDPHPQGKGM